MPRTKTAIPRRRPLPSDLTVSLQLDADLYRLLQARQSELAYSTGCRLTVEAAARSALIRGLTLARR